MKILEKANLIYGAAVVVLSAVFGKYWYLFAAFLALNAADYITGIVKARRLRAESSVRGLDGIIKKLGYWLVVAIAFFLSRSFGEIGKDIGVDLGFTIFFGYFTLAAFIINEIRSILENLVELGVELPAWLVKGLDVAARKIDDIAGGGNEHN